jgi:hypothetical protein
MVAGVVRQFHAVRRTVEGSFDWFSATPNVTFPSQKDWQ